jgi:hypothetical protein
MKTASKVIVRFSVACIFCLPALKAENLLVNGDFTRGTNSWKSVVSGQVTSGSQLKVESLADSGAKTGKVIRITDTDEVAGIGLTQLLPASAGKVYDLTFMSKSTRPNPSQKGPPGYAMIQFLDSKGTWLNNAKAATPTGTPTPEELKLIKQDVCNFASPGKGWEAGTISAKAPEGNVKMVVGFKAGNSGSGTIDISDVVLIQH